MRFYGLKEKDSQWMRSLIKDIFCCILGDALEIGVQWSILKKDIPSFERYMAQLKPYYLDYKYES